jgi:hypothetical protein
MHLDALTLLRDLLIENDKCRGVPASSPTWELVRNLVESEPDVTAQIQLVPYGYEIDVTNHSRKVIAQSSSCRDFGGSYNTKSLSNVAAQLLIESMREIETIYKQQRVQKRAR